MYTPSIDGADCFRAAVMQGDITIGWHDPTGDANMLNVGDIGPDSLDRVLGTFHDHHPLECIVPLLQARAPAALVDEDVEMTPVLSGRRATAEEWGGVKISKINNIAYCYAYHTSMVQENGSVAIDVDMEASVMDQLMRRGTTDWMYNTIADKNQPYLFGFNQNRNTY